MSRRLPLSASNPRQPGRMARDRRLWAHDLSSTSALFVAPRTPIFPGFSRMVARLFANPRGPVGFQELKNTSFFQAFLVTRDYKMGRSRAQRPRSKPVVVYPVLPHRLVIAGVHVG